MTSILLKNINCNGILSDIYIEGSRIKRIMPAGSAGHEGECRIASGVEVMDCEGKTAMPGFINMHTHAGMAMMRGVGEDISFHTWLDRIWEVEKNLSDEYMFEDDEDTSEEE